MVKPKQEETEEPSALCPPVHSFFFHRGSKLFRIWTDPEQMFGFSVGRERRRSTKMSRTESGRRAAPSGWTTLPFVQSMSSIDCGPVPSWRYRPSGCSAMIRLDRVEDFNRCCQDPDWLRDKNESSETTRWQRRCETKIRLYLRFDRVQPEQSGSK